MPERSQVTFEARASFLLGAASVGAEMLAAAGAWGLRALAGEDVAGFCRTSLASPTVLTFVLLRLVVLVGTVAVPFLVVAGLVRGGPRRSLLPGLFLGVLLLLYFANLRAHTFPLPPRHPCLR